MILLLTKNKFLVTFDAMGKRGQKQILKKGNVPGVVNENEKIRGMFEFACWHETLLKKESYDDL